MAVLLMSDLAWTTVKPLALDLPYVKAYTPESD